MQIRWSIKATNIDFFFLHSGPESTKRSFNLEKLLIFHLTQQAQSSQTAQDCHMLPQSAVIYGVVRLQPDIPALKEGW